MAESFFPPPPLSLSLSHSPGCFHLNHHADTVFSRGFCLSCLTSQHPYRHTHLQLTNNTESDLVVAALFLNHGYIFIRITENYTVTKPCKFLFCTIKQHWRSHVFSWVHSIRKINQNSGAFLYISQRVWKI